MTYIVQSFGYGHRDDTPPDATLVVDLRERIRDPHIDPELRELTGLDLRVVEKVRSTPGFYEIIVPVLQASLALSLPDKDTVIAFGCQGGRHRSVVAANEIAILLQSLGRPHVVEHLDVKKPLLSRRSK